MRHSTTPNIVTAEQVAEALRRLYWLYARIADLRSRLGDAREHCDQIETRINSLAQQSSK